MRVVLTTLLVVFNVAQSILAQVMVGENGRFPFQISSVVLVTEFTKLAFAALLFARIAQTHHTRDDRVGKTLVCNMCIPALLYTISNMLIYTNIALLGSTKFQLWSNIRVMMTAVLHRVLLKTPLRIIQWAAIVLLLVGLLMSKLPQCGDLESTLDSMYTGIALVVVQTMCASFAGVYQELQFKNTTQSQKDVTQSPKDATQSSKDATQNLMLKNLVLYVWTCLFSLLKYASETDVYGDSGFFSGFTWTTWCSVMVYASYGQVVSFTLFYCDSIVKVFAGSCAVVVAMAVDVLWLGGVVVSNQIYGAVVVLLSVFFFYVEPSVLLSYDCDHRVVVFPQL